MASMLTSALLNGVFSRARISKPVPFRDKAVLDVPGKPLVIHTPGHTPGEVSFLLTSSGVLLSGDTLVTRDLYTGTHGSPQITRPRLNHDYLQSRASLDHLKDIGSVRMLPGHGHSWEGSMDEAVALADQQWRQYLPAGLPVAPTTYNR